MKNAEQAGKDLSKEEVKVQLIRKFPVEVVETEGSMSAIYYSCPTCGRSVSKGMDKCAGCDQILSWKNIGRKETKNGIKKAIARFEVPMEFEAGDCRKCPISYLSKDGMVEIYECPLRMRGSCGLELAEE